MKWLVHGFTSISRYIAVVSKVHTCTALSPVSPKLSPKQCQCWSTSPCCHIFQGPHSSVSSVLRLLSCLMQHRGFHPPLSFRLRGVFPWSLHGFWLHSPKTLSDESINRGLVCVHVHSIAKTQSLIIAKLRRTYPCGNVKSNCNFVFHNGERKEITWEQKRAQVIFKDVQMVQTLERKERTGRENRQTEIRVHNHITFRVWHVISFLSPLWKTKLQLDFTLPQW